MYRPTQEEMVELSGLHETFLMSGGKEGKRLVCERWNLNALNLGGMFFESGVFRDCLFVWASCEHTNFVNADLTGSNFTRSNCRNAEFAGANLSSVIGDEKYIKNICAPNAIVGAYTCDAINIRGNQYGFYEWTSFSDEEVAEIDGYASANRGAILNQVVNNPALNPWEVAA